MNRRGFLKGLAAAVASAVVLKQLPKSNSPGEGWFPARLGDRTVWFRKSRKLPPSTMATQAELSRIWRKTQRKAVKGLQFSVVEYDWMARG